MSNLQSGCGEQAQVGYCVGTLGDPFQTSRAQSFIDSIKAEDVVEITDAQDNKLSFEVVSTSCVRTYGHPEFIIKGHQPKNYSTEITYQVRGNEKALTIFRKLNF